MEFAIRYLFIPGKVETLVMILNCEGVSLLSHTGTVKAILG